MKKVILFAAILFAGVSVVKGQDSVHGAANGEDSDNTTLTVKLQTIQSIKVNQPSVSLVYSTIENYRDGVSSTPSKHLNVYSTGNFSVLVNYETTGLTDTEEVGEETAAMFQSIGVEAYKAGTEELVGESLNLQTAKADQSIISSHVGGYDLEFDVKYQGAGSHNYVNYIKNGAERTFTATVTYSIIPG